MEKYITSEGIEYILERRKRKTVAIKITGQGQVIVCIPLNCSRKLAESFINQKRKWIKVKLEEALRNYQSRPKMRFLDSEKLDIIGVMHIIKIHITAKSESYLVAENQTINIHISHQLQGELRISEAEALLRNWLMKRAHEIFQERTAFYSRKMMLLPNRITVKDQKTLWGSCSSKNNLNFNWKLVTAPLPILDYVVIHELCHMVHRNHSKDYWNYVQQIMPDYKEKIQWLKINGSMLGI